MGSRTTPHWGQFPHQIKIKPNYYQQDHNPPGGYVSLGPVHHPRK